MACFSPMSSLLHKAAPRLSKHFFACTKRSQSRCSLSSPLRSAHNLAISQTKYKSLRQTPFLQAFRSQSTATVSSYGSPAVGSDVAKRIAKQSFFPSSSTRHVRYWLYGSAASVFGLIVFGALTRLTESGLSITEWRPLTGTIPPWSTEDWQIEFDKYRASPEFKVLNSHMELSDFKRIYWMEYTHRLWGRVVGLSFLIPTVYFIARRRVSRRMARNLVLINVLIGLQGGVGWWMVKSGLKDDLFAEGSQPRVSQYRLATHLALAFTVYLSMVWNALSIDHRWGKIPPLNPKLVSHASFRALRRFRHYTFALAALIGTTAFSGAFVAGLDAGLIYNEFPYMGLDLAPPRAELFNPFYSRAPSGADLWWRNMLENPSLAQLDHRILAASSFLAVHALVLHGFLSPHLRRQLPAPARRALAAALGLVWAQVGLGLATLLYLVPTPVAAAHQAGALALLTGVVVLGTRLPRLPRSPTALVGNAVKGQKPGGTAVTTTQLQTMVRRSSSAAMKGPA